MEQDEYYICVGALTTLVRATDTQDSVILAKARALGKGYVKPRLVSINFADGSTKYFCHVFRVEEVTIKESICEKCPQELSTKPQVH